jgi:hypothetical protein
MKPQNRKLILAVGFLILAILACSLPGFSSPTPFVFPTANLTMTALFDPTQFSLVTLTPRQSLIQTATPGQSAEATRTPTASPLPATQTPVSMDTVTVSPSPPPTGFPDQTGTPTLTIAASRRPFNLVAALVAQPPTIDGDLSDWTQDSVELKEVVYGAANHSGADDLSGLAMLAWDETFLYLAMAVKDDVYVQNTGGVNLFRGDSLEVLLDRDLEGDFNVPRLNDDDFQLGISPGSPSPGVNPESYLWYPSSRAGARDDVIVAARAIDDGYQVEAAIPWSLFNITPQAGDQFGFALSISDNDLIGQAVQQSMVSNVPTRLLGDPTTWGGLSLGNP